MVKVAIIMENKLTPTQALEQGYEYYVYPGDGYQCLKSISDGDIDFSKNPMATSKESIVFKGTDSDQIRDLLADANWEQWNEITGDDTESVHDLFKEIDFSTIENIINEKLESLRYYRQSGIELIEDNNV